MPDNARTKYYHTPLYPHQSRREADTTPPSTPLLPQHTLSPPPAAATYHVDPGGQLAIEPVQTPLQCLPVRRQDCSPRCLLAHVRHWARAAAAKGIPLQPCCLPAGSPSAVAAASAAHLQDNAEDTLGAGGEEG